MNITDKLLSTRSGELNQQIRIRRAVITRDAELNELKTYVDSKPIWAAVTQQMAGYSKQAGIEPVHAISYEIIVRYGAAVAADDLIRYRSADLKVTTPVVDVGGRHKYLVFGAEELREG